ncbi:MAG: DUF4358 domain-containing protein [Eubacteriales bacterium]|nr:DUF4358 domain-containing protein [Eubacteriales bacterium]
MKLKFIALLLLLTLTLSACSTPSVQLLNPKETVEQLQKADTFTPELQELDEALMQKYLMIDASWYNDFYMLLDTSRASCEQILVITAKDKESASNIESALKAYTEALIQQYKDYVPEELPKLENAVLHQKNLQFIYAVAPNHNAIIQNLNTIWK